MEKTKAPSNPLAVAVLVLLFERPMHPYEIAAALRVRNKGDSIKIRYGSLYTVIEGLNRDGLIEVKETVREGRRPERTVYAITSSGLERMRAWLKEMIGVPVKEYPRFEAGLSLITAVPPGEAVDLLKARLKRLGEMAEELRAALEIATRCIEPVFVVENECHLALIETEHQFVDRLIQRIEEGEAYTRRWKTFHERGGPSGPREGPPKGRRSEPKLDGPGP